jgi:UDP-N-acetylmuramate dehydrogenase
MRDRSLMEGSVRNALAVLGKRAVLDHPIGPRTTFRIGGSAAVYFVVETSDDVELVQNAVAASGIEVAVLGRGSNLLVSDSGFPGLVVELGRAYEVISREGSEVAAGGAANLPVVARKTASWGLTGFEWAVGVPGSIGGAVRMNAGGHGSQMADVLVGAQVVDLLSTGPARWVQVDDLGLGYRTSALGEGEMVLGARLSLEPGDSDQAKRSIAEVVAWRRANQPGGQNCGSVFTNPPGASAGRLIEESGLKGLRVGSASVSPKHANFFQADPGGRAQDMRDLIETVREQVALRTGIVLECEVRMLGW